LVICPFEQYLEYSLRRHTNYSIEHTLLVVGGIQQHLFDVSDGEALTYPGAVLTTFGQGSGEDDAAVPGTGWAAGGGEQTREVSCWWYVAVGIQIAQVAN